jgi:hypothetical protein
MFFSEHGLPLPPGVSPDDIVRAVTETQVIIQQQPRQKARRGGMSLGSPRRRRLRAKWRRPRLPQHYSDTIRRGPRRLVEPPARILCLSWA